jgi:hypothetical protein
MQTSKVPVSLQVALGGTPRLEALLNNTNTNINKRKVREGRRDEAGMSKLTLRS